MGDAHIRAVGLDLFCNYSGMSAPAIDVNVITTGGIKVCYKISTEPCENLWAGNRRCPVCSIETDFQAGKGTITGILGKGGMGEGYLADDTKLDRQVAIKVLPDAVRQDPERLARFRREVFTSESEPWALACCATLSAPSALYAVSVRRLTVLRSGFLPTVGRPSAGRCFRLLCILIILVIARVSSY